MVRTMRWLPVLALGALFLAACGPDYPPYPLRMTQAEWQALSPEEQAWWREEAARLRQELSDARELQIQAEERRRDRLCAFGVEIYCD